MTATASSSSRNGTDTVTEAQYPSSPVGPLTLGIDYQYFDVVDSSGSSLRCGRIDDCNGATLTGSAEGDWSNSVTGPVVRY